MFKIAENDRRFLLRVSLIGGLFASFGVAVAGMLWVMVSGHYDPGGLPVPLLVLALHFLPAVMMALIIFSSWPEKRAFGLVLVAVGAVTSGPGIFALAKGDWGDWMLWATYVVAGGALVFMGIAIVRRRFEY